MQQRWKPDPPSPCPAWLGRLSAGPPSLCHTLGRVEPAQKRPGCTIQLCGWGPSKPTSHMAVSGLQTTVGEDRPTPYSQLLALGAPAGPPESRHSRQWQLLLGLHPLRTQHSPEASQSTAEGTRGWLTGVYLLSCGAPGGHAGRAPAHSAGGAGSWSWCSHGPVSTKHIPQGPPALISQKNCYMRRTRNYIFQ